MSLLSRVFGQIRRRSLLEAADGVAAATSEPVPAAVFPDSAEALKSHPLIHQWWYYGVELLPGVEAAGTFPRDLPMLPRTMLRNCDLAGMTCLDLGSMEGLMPVLMCRGGAARVIAADFSGHCLEKMAAIKHYYQADFDFREVGLMYDLDKKMPDGSFDLINCSGLLYHVVSPMHVLMGVRPLLKRNGLMIVSTNVVLSDRCLMEFNDGGRLQEEANTFWYLSVKYLDYMLRFLKLQPVDCAYFPHHSIKSSVRYVADVPSGYLSVVCRAADETLPFSGDGWMQLAFDQSWEMRGLTDWARVDAQALSPIRYKATIDRQHHRAGGTEADLSAMVLAAAADVRIPERMDTQYLRLADWS